MRKLIMAVMALAVGGLAGAQTLKAENGDVRISSCYGTQDGVQCDATYVLTKKQNLEVTFYDSDFTATLPNGDQVKPELSSGGSKDYSTYANFKAQYNVPVKLTLIFNIPNTTASIRALAFKDERVENIAIRSSDSAAPTPAPTPAAPAQAVNINISGNWNASLTNCRQSAPGVVVCTATLRK